MKESEVTGYSEEGCCDEPRGAVGYEPEVVYEAHVNAHVSIYFMFSRRQNVKRVSVMRSDVSDGIWTNYNLLGTATEIHHSVPVGMWILRIHVGCRPDWLFRHNNGTLNTPTVFKAWGISGKHYHWYEKAKKEVKSKMVLHVIDVIFFNRKTKKVEYRELKVAHDTEGAYMLAAQEFGKYDPKLHVKYAHCMFGFNEQNEEEDE